jgi:SagB-type dehydrogenase family enzyme
VLSRRAFLVVLGAFIAGAAGCVPWRSAQPGKRRSAEEASPSARADTLPPPAGDAGDSRLSDVIGRRRSVRRFQDAPISEEQVTRMLWAAQGVTDPGSGFRAAPSAGALYPLELYVASARGVSRYVPARHALQGVLDSDVRSRLALAALGQGFVAQAPVVFVITGVYARTAAKYGRRAERYVHMEAGHAAQNLLLMAVNLGLGGVPVGAFDDGAVRRIIGAPREETPLYLIPVGVAAI